MGKWSLGFHGDAVAKNPLASARGARDTGSSPGLGRKISEVGNDKQLQCSCLQNSIDRGAWRATVHDRVAESHRTEADRLKWSPGALKSKTRVSKWLHT